jgi:hypothetical protein
MTKKGTFGRLTPLMHTRNVFPYKRQYLTPLNINKQRNYISHFYYRFQNYIQRTKAKFIIV